MVMVFFGMLSVCLDHFKEMNVESHSDDGADSAESNPSEDRSDFTAKDGEDTEQRERKNKKEDNHEGSDEMCKDAVGLCEVLARVRVVLSDHLDVIPGNPAREKDEERNSAN